MIVFPNCKINLGLQITGKRSDGFHNLQTVFYPIAFNDALEVLPNNNAANGIEFNATGIAIDGDPQYNLCVGAYHLLKQDFPTLPPVNIHLHKAIPLGAGLGGGSSNAAWMLKLLNQKFQLNLTNEQLVNYALQLGSDCPFFIINKPCFASGRGEILETIDLDLSAYSMVLVNPGIHVPTAWAFSKITPAASQYAIPEIIKEPVHTWKEKLVNDFETVVFAKFPQIKTIKDMLYQQGALYAAMSGSGSTVFGIFDGDVDLLPFKKLNYFIKKIN